MDNALCSTLSFLREKGKNLIIIGINLANIITIIRNPLPMAPNDAAVDSLEEGSICLDKFGYLGGEGFFVDRLKVNEPSSTNDMSMGSMKDNIFIREPANGKFFSNLQRDTFNSQRLNFDREVDVQQNARTKTYDEMMGECTSKVGYLVWLTEDIVPEVRFVLLRISSSALH
jgi:hypothetical protein